MSSNYDKKVFDKMFRDAEKKIDAYTRSEENLKECEPFDELNKKYLSIKKKYDGMYQEFNTAVKASAYRREYAKGGLTIHRGYYSPSQLDLVVGGSKRGRLLKKFPKSGVYDYEYIFDDKDNMICCIKQDGLGGEVRKPVSAEFFVYESDKVLSLIYDLNSYLELRKISESHYVDGALVRYESALCVLADYCGGCTEIEVEEFGYDDSLMRSIMHYHYMPKIKLLDKHRYIFERDAEGYLSTYTYEDLSGHALCAWGKRDPLTFNVLVKRR